MALSKLEAAASTACPCCGREFKSVFDYPLVRVLSFERLPIPEAVDDMSAAATQKALEWHRKNPADAEWSRRGINMTPEIARACETREIADYFQHLSSLAGQIVAPNELLPSLPPDRLFQRAYPVPATPIFLGIHESARNADEQRTAVIDAMCRGVNLGSAGGPTLTILGPIARLTYRGLLAAEPGAG